MKQPNSIGREIAIMAGCEAVCVVLMLAIFALAGYFNTAAVLGGLLGWALAVGNYGLMALGVILASKKAENQDVRGGTQTMRSSMLLRSLLLLVILILAVKSRRFNPISLLLPLLFVRPILGFCELFRKSGDKKS